jgi:hypothetical protein
VATQKVDFMFASDQIRFDLIEVLLRFQRDLCSASFNTLCIFQIDFKSLTQHFLI